MTRIRAWIAAFALWLLKWAEGEPTEDPVDTAVRSAFLRVGLPGDQYGPDFDLMRSGKLAAVLKLAADELRVDSEFNTVADLIRYLRED